MKLKLCLHAGAAAATLEQVTQTFTPSPKDRWHPIAHRALYNQVVTALGNLNMRVVEEQHALTRDGQRYFGLLQVENDTQAGTDFGYVLGLRNAHDKGFCAGLAVGSGVFVCDNLAFSGEIKIARKHTTFINRDLPILTGKAVGQLHERWHNMANRFGTYKTTELVDAQANDFIIRALEMGACTGQQIPHIVKEWRAPSHPEFAKDGRTAWRLFNAFTEAYKDSGLFVMPKRTQALHTLMDAECGLMAPAANN
jgi:hypothetical protein